MILFIEHFSNKKIILMENNFSGYQGLGIREQEVGVVIKGHQGIGGIFMVLKTSCMLTVVVDRGTYACDKTVRK